MKYIYIAKRSIGSDAPALEFPGVLPASVRGRLSVWGARTGKRRLNLYMAAGLSMIAVVTAAGWTAAIFALIHLFR